MAANLESKLVVTDPDFNTIKTNLKNFLRSQDTFSDYDFDGSALSTLIDLLAYNTHYMSFYVNMLANESFLDTASVRDSVISHAKMLGYTPHSTTSSTARINLSFTAANNATVANTTALTLPKFTKFSSTAIDGVNYIFTNLNEVTVTKANNALTFPNLDITEGTPVNYVFTHNEIANPTQEFVLPDLNIDTSTLEVIVQTSSVDTTQVTYTAAGDSTSVAEDSKVYYLDQTNSQKYKIYFGDDILGKKLSDGNIVIVSYLLSKGSSSNKATGFTLLDAVGTMTTPTIEIVQTAAGGSEAETLQSIKFTAPKNFVSNNRAVTKNDYIALIKKNYPSLEAVNVWGGEENVPPVYGKVFVSAKPALGYTITLTEKENIIKNVINPISILTVTPEFINPDYNYLNLDVKVTYDPTATTKTPGQIESTVRSAINNFANNNLDTFNAYFKPSRLSRDIDNSDTSILSSQVDIKIEKRLEPVLGSSKSYSIDFHTALKRTAGKNRITSNPAYSAYDTDDNLRKFYFEEVPLAYTGLSSVNVLFGGSNLETAPLLRVYGDGVGANAYPVITNGKVTSVKVDSNGSDYGTASVKAYDTDGNEITTIVLEAVIENKYGKLRSFYYDENQLKVIYSEDVGTIDYTNGTISIKNFLPIDIDNDFKILKFYAAPENNLFNSSKNSILTIDIEDSAAITISTIQVIQ
jgi:hypothetical protein